MDLLTKEVERKITLLLPDKFGLIIDGWSTGNGYLVLGVIGVFPDAQGMQTCVLLGIGPLLDETRQGGVMG